MEDERKEVWSIRNEQGHEIFDWNQFKGAGCVVREKVILLKV